ncbi:MULTISPECIES: isopeptide-forming domain-containing fimbrial protein [Gordonibacter]|uniref:Isopeptide-forming domain-containing fimbrial protein n=1 Tax=Gordonibacter faecis TaxID=3047475 RepID=A0ABT7DK01_9ACTN|nr:isopeptide-forming domain-containing fimbrial protein [Gordonibacter sp. KGMB12511]MDJ1649858.1 isopeptide-forming domain-containing fimbrial protein [Gordonibacter sp. KGMB12511]
MNATKGSATAALGAAPPAAGAGGRLLRALLALLLAAGVAPAAALPGTAYAAPPPIERVDEDDFAPEGYEESVEWTGVEVERGFVEVPADFGPDGEGIATYMFHNTEEEPDATTVTELAKGAGFAAFIDGNSGYGGFALRFTGGSYDGVPVDMVVTLTDWNYLEPEGGWESHWEYDRFPIFRPGVYVSEAYDAYAGSGLDVGKEGYHNNVNFYTLGITDLEVEVQWVRPGTNDPYPVKGHMTCMDLDMFQTFSYDGSVWRAEVSNENDFLSTGGHVAASPGVGLNENGTDFPEEYRDGLVGAYYDTTEDKGTPLAPAVIRFGTSWMGTGTAQSFFALSNEFITTPPPPPTGGEGWPDISKSADRDEGVSVGDQVEFTVDFQALTWGENARVGWRYTTWDVLDYLPWEMRYVDGSGYLVDEGGDRVEGAGEVVYEGRNEETRENIVRFEFYRDFLASLDLRGQHYRLVFRAELTEYPADGALEVWNECSQVWNSDGRVDGTPVRVGLLEPSFEVDKQADSYEYEVGDVISYIATYRQTVENAQSRETVVSDNLPEGLELIPESVQATGIADLPAPEINENTWSYSFDKFGYGDTLVVTYQGRATSSGNGYEIVNNASIHGNNTMDYDDPAEVWVNTADVSVEKSADRGEAHVGPSDADPGFVEYTVTLANDKAGTIAHDVVVGDDSLPQGMKVGRNNDGSLMIEGLTENGAAVPMTWIGDRAEGTLATIQYPVGSEDDVHNQTEPVTPAWRIDPAGTGWRMTIDHLAYGQTITLIYRAYPESAVAGWEIENEAEIEAANDPDGDSAQELVWVNQPSFAVDKKASNDAFSVNDVVTYEIKAVNARPGTLARNVVISDLARTEGVELLRDSIQVYDSRGEEITDDCTITYKHSPQGAETFIIETHRDLVAASTADLADLYDELLQTATEEDFNAVMAKIDKAIEEGAGADHESAAELIENRPVWKDGAIEWSEGSNPLGFDPGNPRPDSLSCETELTVCYRVQIQDAELAGQTVDNTALVVSDEPNTATTDDEVVDVKGAKLVTTKAADKDVYQVGETAHYTVTTTQAREDVMADNVVVGDALQDPESMSIVEGTLQVTGPDGKVVQVEPVYERDEAGNIVGYTIETGLSLADEQSVVVAYDATAKSVDDSVRNAASSSADNAVGSSAVEEVEIVAPRAAAALDKAADVHEARVGDIVTYALTATVADNPAENVVISDNSLPEGMPIDLRNIELEINGVDVPSFQLDVDGNGFAAHLGDLAAGDVARITYTATVRDAALAGTSVVNTAYLDSDTIDEPLRDDEHVTVRGDEPAIDLVKSADKDTAHVGDTVTYTITAVANADAENVRIGDTSMPAGMPIDLDAISVTFNGRAQEDVGATIIGNGFEIPFGDLLEGDEIVIGYTADVEDASLAGTTVDNVAVLDSDDLDEPLEAVESVDVVGDVDAPPEPESPPIEKTVDNPTPAPGDTVAYAVAVNALDGDLVDAVVTDTPDEGIAIDLESVAVQIGGEPHDAFTAELDADGNLVVRIGDVAEGERAIVTYDAVIDAEGSRVGEELANEATLTADGLDPASSEASVVPTEPEGAPGNPLKGLDQTGDALAGWLADNWAGLAVAAALAAVGLAVAFRPGHRVDGDDAPGADRRE